MTKTIFVIDDNAHVLVALTMALESQGWVVRGFSSIRALEAYINSTPERPDLVLSDYSLEHGCTGLDVVAFMRARFGKNVPALILSGVVTPAEINHIEDAGLKLLFKSAAPEDLIAEVHSAIR